MNATNRLNLAELHCSNELLGDRAALDAAWVRDGYWFFRDVLDKAAVARLRGVYMNELAKLGVADHNDPEARYNGKSLKNFPLRMEPLVELRAWQPFVVEPGVHNFFKRLLGDEPFWMPTPEYRATPPAQDRSCDRFDYLHQDGFYNQGIPFRICWFALAEIDAEVGGVVLAEGMHHQTDYLHDMSKPPLFPIPDEAIPAHAWRRATYRPGDVLMMDIRTPHTGIANYSDRFRLSLDIRVMGRSGNVPLVGTITAVTTQSVSIQSHDGRSGTFLLDENTFCRGLDGVRVSLGSIPERLHPGDQMIVSAEQGRAILIRPLHT